MTVRVVFYRRGREVSQETYPTNGAALDAAHQAVRPGSERGRRGSGPRKTAPWVTSAMAWCLTPDGYDVVRVDAPERWLAEEWGIA